MTLTADVIEVAARLDGLLAEAEAGGRVVTLRGAEPVAKIVKAVRGPESVVEEFLMWRDEDRRRLREAGERM